MLADIDAQTILGLAVLVVFVLTGWARKAGLSAADRARINRIDAKLDAVLGELGIRFVDPTMPEGLSDEVKRLASDRRKIEAIRLHRKLTGVDLYDAKQAVDGYLERLDHDAA